VLGTIEIAGGVKEALVLQHLLRESPLWFHFLVSAPPLIMHHEAEWCRMSCSGQVLARFAARSRPFHLVAGRDPRSSRCDHPALLAPTYSTGFFVRDSFNHVSKLVSTDSPQSADLVRAYEAVSI